MQSAASSLIEAFKTAFSGTDWDKIPYDMFLYGSGGIGCWGTLCGIPNGLNALLNLIGLHGALGGEILGHYSKTQWPTDQIPNLYTDPYYGSGGTGGYTWPKQPVPDGDVLAHVISYSPLCHVSISKWCYAAGVDLNDLTLYATSHKNDRCGKICADMSAYTAELINYYALNAGVETPYVLPPQTANCKTCHWKVSDPYTAIEHPAQCGLMDCAECHIPGTYHVGKQLIIEDVWTEGSGPKDTFNPGDPIEYKVKFTVLGAGSCFVKTYKSRAKGTCGRIQGLSKKETLMTGTYEWSWPGIVPGSCSGPAKVIITLILRDYKGGPKLDEQKMTHSFTIV